jgi:hypothetical protein
VCEQATPRGLPELDGGHSILVRATESVSFHQAQAARLLFEESLPFNETIIQEIPIINVRNLRINVLTEDNPPSDYKDFIICSYENIALPVENPNGKQRKRKPNNAKRTHVIVPKADRAVLRRSHEILKRECERSDRAVVRLHIFIDGLYLRLQ